MTAMTDLHGETLPLLVLCVAVCCGAVLHVGCAVCVCVCYVWLFVAV